jgi:hypothetical protein
VTLGENEGRNVYVDDAGRSIVPIVSFSDEDEDAGYWLSPRRDLLDTQRNINVDETSRLHLARVSGFGQWVAERQSQNADDNWGAAVQFGADVLLKAPDGWSLNNKFAQADLAGLAETAKQHLQTVTSLNSLPPGSVLSEGRTVPSGVALAIERQPLDEERRDQVEVYRASVVRLLDVVRHVYNAHSGEPALVGVPRWTPGQVRPPADPEQQNRVDEARVRLGIASPVTLLMEREGLAEDEAVERVAKMQAQNRPAATLSAFGARLVSGSPLSDAMPAGPLAQSRAATAARNEEQDDEDDGADSAA